MLVWICFLPSFICYMSVCVGCVNRFATKGENLPFRAHIFPFLSCIGEQWMMPTLAAFCAYLAVLKVWQDTILKLKVRLAWMLTWINLLYMFRNFICMEILLEMKEYEPWCLVYLCIKVCVVQLHIFGYQMFMLLLFSALISAVVILTLIFAL